MGRKVLTILSVLLLLLCGMGLASGQAAVKGKGNNVKKKAASENVVYLTFDDGPNKYTPEILNVLKKKKVKATFFMIEGNIKRNPKIVKRMIKEGHYPGLHSVSHDAKKLYKGHPDNVAKEMDQTRKTLKKVAKVNSNLVRVPYGSKPYMKKPLRDHLVKKGFKMWDWNIDTLDWKYNKSNPAKITQNVKAGLKGKKGPVVILFHDSKGTAKQLPGIIDYLLENGYKIEVYQPEKHFMMNYWKDKRL
ncbi:polysaccharide deacetylase family protein [Mesobacillus thioparans]|uniref:polysaccharide deacetylase family protein n=1 Tax=Mesobacillus thioparans TaxID=370439 RepID=UPI0039EEF223